MFADLWIMCLSFWHGLMSLIWLAVLIFFVIYTFGLVLTRLIGKQSALCKAGYSRLQRFTSGSCARWVGEVKKHKTNPFWRENIQCKVANVSHVETASWASSQNRLDCMLLCDDVSNLLVLSDKYSCRNPSILRSTCVLFEHTNWRMFLNTSNTIIVQLNDQISNLIFDCWTLAVEHHLWIDTLHNLWIYAFVALYLIISLQSATMPP